jgi:hypothetical protein
MSDQVQPLRHVDAVTKTDEKLREEARLHLARTPQLQVAAEILAKLRSLSVPWWSPERLRHAFPASVRMQWYAERPDLRQSITHRLTGLAPRAARARSAVLQAELIEAALDCGDIDTASFESAFDPRDIVVYGPVRAYWKRLRECMPWDNDNRAHQLLVGWMLRTLIAEKSEDGAHRKPVLSALQVRTAIDTRLWQTRIPMEVRVAIDEARLQLEKRNTREAFHARQELELATPEIIASHVPLRELQRIFLLAERALGFDDPESIVVMEKPKTLPQRSRPALESIVTPADLVLDDVFFDGRLPAIEASAK